jgi:hypothetical protein
MPLSEGELEQVLVRLVRSSNHGEALEKLYPVRFVPLIGTEGWSPAERSPADAERSSGPAHIPG